MSTATALAPTNLRGPLFTIFRPIPGFPGYGVDSDGGVWSSYEQCGGPKQPGRKWRKLSLATVRDGRRRATLYKDGTPKGYFVHRLVLQTFIGPCPDGMEGCHNNGRADDNRLANLRWDTHLGNTEDMDRHGSRPRGERHGCAKLTDALVCQIRSRLEAGEFGRALAREFGCSRRTIAFIRQGKTWTHLLQEAS